MSLNYTAGARTRNVINIAKPGSTTEKAYSLAAPNTVPSSTTDGFKNFHSQKTLHVMIHNNDLERSGAGISVFARRIHIYVYNSSLGGAASWSPLRLVDRDTSTNEALFPPVVNPDSIGPGGKLRMIIPIDGAERIAVWLEQIGGPTVPTAGTLDIYLGVNTI
jgi:hypothetical protein|tara:strand:- start:2325 stop:2813 length:489 start_codon:yes stop_codon:yes gene_type:complete